MAKTLNERIKEATAQAAPSMVPTPYEVKAPPKQEEVIPDISEIVESPSDRRALRQLVINSAELGLAEKEIKKERAPITAQIKKYLSKYQVGKMNVEQFRVNFYSVPRSSISRNKLVVALSTLGILPSDIAEILAASTTTADVSTLRIGVIGADDDE
jgi:hypothetical protein